MEKSMKLRIGYMWTITMICLGLFFNHLEMGNNEFVGFDSVGNYLVYIGVLSGIIFTLKMLFKKKRVVDERMEFVAAKAHGITFLSLLLISFLVIIIDGVDPIKIPYHLFMSYIICIQLVILLISNKVLLRIY